MRNGTYPWLFVTYSLSISPVIRPLNVQTDEFIFNTRKS